jgi:glutaminyl-tRNA synthetase
MSSTENKESLNFLEAIIEEDLRQGKNEGRVLTRFPPEPNGYLHIGHATTICLNFGLAQKYGGQTNLRFDDTNPVTEETEYVESIIEDVRWLGFEPAAILYASDYFQHLYDFAIQLIQKGVAYVDDSSAEEIATMKGTPTQPGTNSPFRDRSVAENLDLFVKMKEGAFPEGSKVLRAKIDMASSNMIMRDPLLYRIKFAHHHRTGDQWCIYPMYDMAHGQSDSIEKITHSICTLEFVPHRELYDWLIDQLEIFPSKQYEFARRNLSYTVVSKRKLLKLVNEGHVNGWDDPRMPTIAGMRRRGYPAAGIREWAHRIGIAKRENIVDLSLLEFCVREELNKSAERVMVVLDPIRLTITNYPEGQVEEMQVDVNPEDAEAGKRPVSFSKHLFIEKDDFMENPPPKYFRLAPGQMVRLKNAYIIHCDRVIKDPETGEVTEILASYVPESRSGQDTSGLKVKGTIHWVSEAHALSVEVRLYDRLFLEEAPDGDKEVDFLTHLNPESMTVLPDAKAEASLADSRDNSSFQFIRLGYFVKDKDSHSDKLIFNRTATLKDSWSKGK